MANLRELIAATSLVILNTKIEAKLAIFFVPCDLEIWWMTLTLCMDITSVDDNWSWKVHATLWKSCNGDTARWPDRTFLRAAWVQDVTVKFSIRKPNAPCNSCKDNHNCNFVCQYNMQLEYKKNYLNWTFIGICYKIPYRGWEPLASLIQEARQSVYSQNFKVPLDPTK